MWYIIVKEPKWNNWNSKPDAATLQRNVGWRIFGPAYGNEKAARDDAAKYTQNSPYWIYDVEKNISTLSNQTTSSNNGDAVNDHTCPTCHNTRCSKSEKTCWKCGNSLH